jgi:hypothetical protein
MADFTVRSDSVDVEQIMRQNPRAYPRETRRGLHGSGTAAAASVKLEKFSISRGVRSDLVEAFLASIAS